MRNSRAFTLIELLTVIAIIGILAAILIPTLGQVRENARKSKCSSNMRQIALACLNYEADHGHLPGPSVYGITSPLAHEEATGGKLGFTSHLSTRLEDYLGEGRFSVWECPSNDAAAKENRRVFKLNNRTSTLPMHFFGRSSDNAALLGEGMPVSRIFAAGSSGYARNVNELTRIWMISDIDGINYSAAITQVAGASLSASVLPPHNGRNYVFFDGHVEFIPYAELPDVNPAMQHPANP
jgi:prepilin-type N-terminal cleavage/methylation domain-containing protein/prepilin-type processing-associated H-X9-DG protein